MDKFTADYIDKIEPPFVLIPEAERRTQHHRTTLGNWQKDGTMPKGVPLGKVRKGGKPAKIGWPREVFDAWHASWVASLTAQSTGTCASAATTAEASA